MSPFRLALGPTPRPKPILRNSMQFQGLDSVFWGHPASGLVGDDPGRPSPKKRLKFNDNIRLWKIGFGSGKPAPPGEAVRGTPPPD